MNFLWVGSCVWTWTWAVLLNKFLFLNYISRFVVFLLPTWRRFPNSWKPERNFHLLSLANLNFREKKWLELHQRVDGLYISQRLNCDGIFTYILLMVQKSQTTTWHVWNPVNNGIIIQSLVVSRILWPINRMASVFGMWTYLWLAHSILKEVFYLKISKLVESNGGCIEPSIRAYCWRGSSRGSELLRSNCSRAEREMSCSDCWDTQV